MKLSLQISLCAIGCAAALAADPAAAPAASGTNLIEKGSYALGANLGNNLRMQGSDPNIDQVIQGLRDGLANKVKLQESELRENYMSWQKEIRSLRMEKNKKVGDEFLAKKAKEEGVKKFPDGLLYKVLASGKGPQPKPDETVSAHYRGTLIDGTEFDSSYSRGTPLKTPVRGVVPGWQEALTNMHVGDKWELYIPPQLAYGERGAGAKIGPDATLIFEMELIGVEPPNTNAPAIGVGPGGNQPIRISPGGNSQPIRVAPSPGGNQPIRVAPSK